MDIACFTHGLYIFYTTLTVVHTFNPFKTCYSNYYYNSKDMVYCTPYHCHPHYQYTCPGISIQSTAHSVALHTALSVVTRQDCYF